MRPRLNRRSFLKLSALGLAGWGLAPAQTLPPPPGLSPRLAATLPIPFPHHYVADPEILLTRLPAEVDLLLVPAYIAAGLIQRGRLLPLAGPPGRAHDPEGAYTLPYRCAASAVLHPAGRAPADPWQPALAWPSFGRLMLGAALQRRGHSPNDAHAGHVAQAGQDLAALRPSVLADPLAALRAGAVPAALLPVPLLSDGTFGLDEDLVAAVPPWGGVLIEYDWVLPTSAPDPALALAFLKTLPPALPPNAGPRLVPLAPLPERTQAQYAHLWTTLTRAQREARA